MKDFSVGLLLANTARMGIFPAPTLVPRGPAGATSTDRAELAAALSFLDASRDPAWDVVGLRRWFDEHLVQAGWMMTPMVVTEVGAGTVPLHGQSSQGVASQSKLPKVLGAARKLVLAALRGLVASPSDDRFLMAALFTGRVQRTRANGVTRWVVRPEPTATLSSVILGLFTADILPHREMYDRSLCICDACDRVTFEADAARTMACPDHRPSSSGFIRKVTAPELELAVAMMKKPSFR